MIRVGIIGATGYAGGELVRILLNHKDAKIVWYGSRSYIDKKYYQVYQNMFQLVEDICKDDNLEELAKQVDVIFTATPQGFLAGLLTEEILSQVKIVDLSADYRIKDVATYDLKPEMSAPQVCEKLLDAIRSEKYDVIVINFANPDMVGHTGVISAAIKAIETVDECVGKAVQAVKDVDGVLFICADHGNAEQMIDYTTGQPHTAHTTNPVPFILVNYDPAYTLKEDGCLADIVPTLIDVMGMEQPVEMTGKSLLIQK